MTCTFERFTKNVADHQLTIHRDDGLFRHLTVQKPNTSNMRYHITTWPSYLCISGDMGCFVFSRIPDMFQFFRGNPDKINPRYWQEKLQAGAGFDGAKEVSEEFDGAAYDERIDEYLANFIKDLDSNDTDEAEQIAEAAVAVNEFKNCREDSEWDAVSRINNWDPHCAGGLELDDFFEGRLTKFRFHYIWCCYAIVHAIALYDAVKASEVAV